MKWLTSFLLPTALLVQWTPTKVEGNWTDVAARLTASVGRVTHPVPLVPNEDNETAQYARALMLADGDDPRPHVVCSAFSIDRGRHYFMTAHHCLGLELRVDQQPATIVAFSEIEDWAILQVPGLTKHALQPERKAARMGDTILGYGFAYGQPQAQLRAGIAANPRQVWFHSELQGIWVSTDFPFIPGMSGGPLVSDRGNVVGLVQRTNEATGLAKPIVVLWTETAPYWE